MHASAWDYADDVVGRTHDVFALLNHQHTVANVAQVFQGVDQSVVVAMVLADAGLDEHIPRPNRSCCSSPLHVGDDAHERLLNVKLAVRGQALLQLVNVAALGLWIGWRMTHFDAVN